MALLPPSIAPPKNTPVTKLLGQGPSSHPSIHLATLRIIGLMRQMAISPSLLMATAAENKFGRNSVSPTMEEANGTAESSQSVT